MSGRKNYTHITLSCLLVAVFVTICFADDWKENLHLSGFISMEAGQFVHYKYQSANYEREFLDQNLLGINISASVHPRAQVFLKAVGSLSYNTMPMEWRTTMSKNPANDLFTPIMGFFIDEAKTVVHCSPDPKDSLIDITVGLFDEKYNTDVRNLGEYLFRTGAFPGYIDQEGFDNPMTRLAGIRVTNNLFNCWHNEFLLSTVPYLLPYNDFSLSYITDVSVVKKVLDIGTGVQFFRCFSANHSQTQPKQYYQSGIAPNYYIENGDTSFYTFAGTKIMARISFDPKPLLSANSTSMLGSEDLKIYSEEAILGLENYPASPFTDNSLTNVGQVVSAHGYDTLAQKMPIMIGLNVPAFKFLDVLSFEVEYYGKKYVNAVPIPAGTKIGTYYPTTPFPYYASGTSSEYNTTDFYAKGDAQWKWSIYAKKTLFNKLFITAQAARDHIRTLETGGLSPIDYDREEAMVKANQWYYIIKVGCNF
jgi:hypothetical protein